MVGLLSSLREQQALAKLVGQSPAFARSIRDLPAIARSEGTVLIGGETGTGKELVARAIHYLSPRATGPFIAVNCGTFTELLFEEELFGHERGAFTDAYTQRPGLVAEAGGGTLFLDEIDTLAPKAQVSILRLLQDKSFRAIGGRTEKHADIRVVAATNAPLESLMQARVFRADLFYRLMVFSLDLPPLRERRDDILLLARHFLKLHAISDEPAEIAESACAVLVAREWPGNVRELENAVIRGIHLRRSQVITAEDVGIVSPDSIPPIEPVDAGSFKSAKQAAILAFERQYVQKLIRECHGNVSDAARKAGKERRDFGKLLKKHNVDPKCFYLHRMAG